MAGLLDLQTEKSYKYLHEVETVAQDILTDKQSKLEISNAQNKFREALRAIEETDERNTWMKVGAVYVQRPSVECKSILRNEFTRAQEDLDELHAQIKEKVHKLRDLEHEPRLEGFTLKPISVAEAKALHKGFGLLK